jgi:hypothetical protein
MPRELSSNPIITQNLVYACSGDYVMKLVERMPGVSKTVIKAKGGYLRNLKYKIFFDLFNTFFGYYTIP